MDKIKILAVDDEESVLGAIENICQEDHLDLTTETSPFKAVTILKYEIFDIFIAGYQTSGMNGIDLLKRVKQLYREDSYIPILCTAYGTIQLFREEQRQMVFHYFIEKPIDIVIAKRILGKAVLGVRIRRNRGRK